jgi:isoleucyl-tRNA synthetase
VCDAAVLGKRLGKAFAGVQTAVKAMSQKDLNSFSQSGSAVVNGETLKLGEDVKIVFEVASAMADVEATSFLGAVALFHTKLRFYAPALASLRRDPYLFVCNSQEMIDSGSARELVNRVQRLRKKAGLVPSDRIEVFLDAPADILQVARTHSDLISHTIGCPMLPASAPPAYMYALLSLQRCICFSAFLTCVTRRAG